MIQLTDNDAKEIKTNIENGIQYSQEVIEALDYYDKLKSLGADNKNTFIPPTETDQTDYATIMKTVGQPAPKSQAEVEAFKGRLAKDVYDKDLSLVDIARSAGFKVPKYEDGPKKGQYKFSETVKTPEFQKFLKDMQESQRVADMRKMVDKETRFLDYTDPETGEQVHIPFGEGVWNQIRELMWPTTLNRLSKGDQNITNADVDKETAINLLEALPFGSMARAPFIASKYGSGAIAKGAAGFADISAAPVAREVYNVSKGEKGWPDAGRDAFTGTLFNYAIPHVLDVGAGSIKEYVPIAKKAIESYLDKRNIGKNIDELLKGPSKARKPDVTFDTGLKNVDKNIPTVNDKQTNELSQFLKKTKDNEAEAIINTDLDMRSKLNDVEYLEWLQNQKDNQFINDYTNYMNSLAKDEKARLLTDNEGKFINTPYIDYNKQIKTPYVQNVIASKSPYSKNMIFDKQGNIYPHIKDEMTEAGIENALEYGPVRVALNEPKTWVGSVIDELTRSNSAFKTIPEGAAKGAGRFAMNKYSESEGGKSIGESINNSMPWGADEKTEEVPTETEEQKKFRQKKGKFYNNERSKEIDEYKKSPEYRWSRGFATFAEKNTPEYQTWLAENIKHLADY